MKFGYTTFSGVHVYTDRACHEILSNLDKMPFSLDVYSLNPR